jgi:uncharacterized protein YciI
MIRTQKLVLAICRDHIDGPSATLREQHLSAHMAYIEKILPHLAVAGPLRDAQRNIDGSMLVYRTDSIAVARQLLEADPYFLAGVWSSVEYKTFNAAAGEWVGGTAW